MTPPVEFFSGPDKRTGERRGMSITPHPHDASEPCPGGCEDIVTVESAVCKAKSDIATLEGRVATIHDRMTRFEARLDEGNTRMGHIETSLNNNSATLATNSSDTAEILEILRDSKSVFKFAGAAGSVVKWALGIASAALIFLYAIKDWPNHG